jgi:glucose-1-phosphate cytidylyltransferase
MKVIILAGGLGTRISEETVDKPKPMVAINGKPILWHIMSIYAAQGIQDFVVATGYKGEVISKWIASLNTNWKIKALDTGISTMTGGRIRRCLDYIGDESVFATYGDGLANVNLNKLLKFHQNQKRLATMTAVRPPARFGVLESNNGLVTHFGEKNQTDSGWINGGFFVVNSSVKNYIEDDMEAFEGHALVRLVADKQLSAYHHGGFWQPMDTLRERMTLSELANLSTPPWLEISD